MKSALALSLAAACALSAMAVPQYAAAVDRDYGSGDICVAKKKEATANGTIAGGAIGALAGAALAGKKDRAAGAVIGGLVGAGVGHQVGKHYIKCSPYPTRVAQTAYSRKNCQWITETYDGRDHDLEICRNKDGVWRPSGRS
ncbi:MAG: hypothetical protein CFE28_11400 [Alphaproteobacteria bacterium PA2]|nr:MAG: hypothetical protein CFE28_11400 [Alphaproteobacteria bacterium PA2]